MGKFQAIGPAEVADFGAARVNEEGQRGGPGVVAAGFILSLQVTDVLIVTTGGIGAPAFGHAEEIGFVMVSWHVYIDKDTAAFALPIS